MLEELKDQVCRANLALVAEGLVIHTWGNVSGIDRAAGLMVIKPSGAPYETMTADQMSVVSLTDGKLVDGLKPSSDSPTHLELYRAFPGIGGVAHTHSTFATVWAQARRDIAALGTTHADYFHGPVPCTRELTAAEIAGPYETNTGKVILERLAGANPLHMPAVLVAAHGPFTWGTSPADCVHNAVVLEYLAKMAIATLQLNPQVQPIPQALLDRHFFRKHGPGAYYGQAKE
jgi:L-ribulose-5-phosphate 4-epimerase